MQISNQILGRLVSFSSNFLTNFLTVRLLKRLLLTLALVSSLGVAGIAAAQTSGAFDMACRGAFASTGGVTVYSGLGFVAQSSVGQTGVGLSTSPNQGLRAGYIQPSARAVARQSTQASDTDSIQQGSILHLAIVQAMVPVSRICQWL